MKKLNTKKLAITAVVAVLAAALIGGYLAYRDYRQESAFLNFAVVDPGRLMRSAQPRPGDLAKIKAEYGLGTILCLRGKEPEEVRLWARSNNVNMVMLQMKADIPPTLDQIGLFFDIMRGDTVDLDRGPGTYFRIVSADPDLHGRFALPVLIHCEGGADRAGVMVALYRMAFMGWTVEQAQDEMKSHHHIPIMHPRQFEFLEQSAPTINPNSGSKK